MTGEVPSTVVRTFKFRLLPRKGQRARLKAALDHTRDLYNAALEERIGAYRSIGETRSYVKQCAGLTVLRSDPMFSTFPVSLQRWPLKKVDLAFSAFFSRVKKGGKPGFPRFRSRERFHSFGFTDRDGWKLDGRRLQIKGVGRVQVHMHRAMADAPLSCQIKRDGKGWVALLTCEVPVEAVPKNGSVVGIDLGISSFFATSDGSLVPGFKAGRRAQREIRLRQRALARCKRGSNNRRKAKAHLARAHERTANARRTFLHQQSALLVRRHYLIAIEDLNVNGLARSALARDVNDAAWGIFIGMLTDKAERAGRTIVKVRPQGTSQTCPECGQVEPKSLSQRIHRCDCGCVLDRDVAAAQVILQRAVAGPELRNVGGYAVRAA